MARLIVNMNGTLQDDLVRTRLATIEALRKAAESLARSAPHPRDFPNGDFAMAQAKTFKRAEALRTMMQELEAEAMALQEEGFCDIGL